MHPFEKSSAGRASSPQGFDIRLKPGWRFDRRRRSLLSESGQKIGLGKLLPQGTKVTPTVPFLADADPETLNEDEALLARCLKMALPPDSDSSAVSAELQRLDGVERIDESPRFELP